ncbi:MAG: DNA/RNA non-specific endonuclease [Rhodospirillales bacterium]
MPPIIRVLALLAALALPFSAAAEREIHAPQCLFGCPLGASSNNDLIFRGIYILSSNDITKFADWAAYRVTRETISSGTQTNRSYRADPVLHPDETLEPPDYKGANKTLKTDRGHQVPLASYTSTPLWRETNYLSNITPQKSVLNQGPWKRLEKAVRDLAQADGGAAVYVMTGPLYQRPMPSLPGADEAHLVPSGYWKIAAVDDGAKVRAAAFIFDQNTPRGANYCDLEFAVTIRAIEDITGLDFFHNLSREAQDAVETETGLPGLRDGC